MIQHHADFAENTPFLGHETLYPVFVNVFGSNVNRNLIILIFSMEMQRIMADNCQMLCRECNRRKSGDDTTTQEELAHHNVRFLNKCASLSYFSSSSSQSSGIGSAQSSS